MTSKKSAYTRARAWFQRGLLKLKYELWEKTIKGYDEEIE